jgi:hypothetical protein
MTHERLDYDTIHVDTVRQMTKLMAAAAIIAPKFGGQLFLARDGQVLPIHGGPSAVPLRGLDVPPPESARLPDQDRCRR